LVNKRGIELRRKNMRMYSNKLFLEHLVGFVECKLKARGSGKRTCGLEYIEFRLAKDKDCVLVDPDG